MLGWDSVHATRHTTAQIKTAARTWRLSGVQAVVKKQSILELDAAAGGDVVVTARPPALLPCASWWALGGIACVRGGESRTNEAQGR